MFKKLFTYMALMMSLASCSDDIFNAPDSELLPEDGKVSVTLSVPEMTEVGTRAFSETDISDLTMLVFDGGKLAQIEPNVSFTQIEGQKAYNFDFTIDEGLRRKKDLEFVALANTGSNGSGFSKNDNIDRYRDQSNNDVIRTADGLVMSGKISLQDLLKFNSISMIRSAAKVTVAAAQLDASGNLQKDSEGNIIIKPGVEYPIAVYGTAVKSPLFAGAYTKTGTSEKPNSWPNEPAVGDVYVHPSQNTGTYQTNCYVILKVPYNGTEYFYRVDFRNADGYMDLLPNHHYQFVIKGEPKGPGFSNMKEAAASPTPMDNEWVEIHDHAPVIYNMVTDGQRELGVSHNVFFSGEPGGTAKLRVKLYSKVDANEETLLSKDNFSKASYITLDKIEKLEVNDSIWSYPVSDSDTKGTVYDVTLKFENTANTGQLESEVRVTWMGLVREIPVIWDRTFDASKLVKSAKLEVFYNGITTTDNDYFGLLANRVNGVSEEANNGSPRNEGFHFPVQYGEGSNLASYKYTVQLEKLLDGNYEYEIYIDDNNSDKDIRDNVKLNGTYKTLTGNANNGVIPEFTISRKADGWDYGVGDLCIRVRATANDEWIYYHMDLYHTGFFHYDSDMAYYGDTRRQGTPALYGGPNAPQEKATYYEVVTMGNNHWLDRNLGATSAEYYVMSNTGATYFGNPDAAGIYYRVAEYNQHQDPTMRTKICPPGYTYPTEYDFDELKKSAEFNTSTVGNHYDASYRAVAPTQANPNGKTVYFPRAGYVDADKSFGSGESRAGYYWTSTAAKGMEKQEIGAWLLAFNLSGNASSFVNAAVYSTGHSDYKVDTESRENDGYAMPVRCVAKSNSQPDYAKTNFYVTGATHVFLYYREGDNLTPVQPWPGIGIADYNTATKKFNLTYTSQTFRPENLYVIFNFKDENGIIHTFSKDGVGAVHTTNRGPKDLYGWKVAGGEQGRAYQGSLNNNIISATTNEVSAALGCSWLIGYAGTAPGTMSGSAPAVLITEGFGGSDPGPTPPTPTDNKYRIYWLLSESSGINIWSGSNGIVNDTYSKDKQCGNVKGYFREGKNGYVYYEFEESNLNSKYPTISWSKYNTGQMGSFSSSEYFQNDSEGVPAVTIHFDTKQVDKGGPSATPTPTPSGKQKYRFYWKKWYDGDSTAYPWLYVWKIDNYNLPTGISSESWHDCSSTVVFNGMQYSYLEFETDQDDFGFGCTYTTGKDQWNKRTGDITLKKSDFNQREGDILYFRRTEK